MATLSLSSLDKRLRAVEATLAAAVASGVQWRKPLIVLSGVPASASAVTSGTTRWSPAVPGTSLTVTYRVDGGPVKPAVAGAAAWGPLAPGAHRLDFYVGGATVPEVSCLWQIEE